MQPHWHVETLKKKTKNKKKGAVKCALPMWTLVQGPTTKATSAYIMPKLFCAVVHKTDHFPRSSATPKKSSAWYSSQGSAFALKQVTVWDSNSLEHLSQDQACQHSKMVSLDSVHWRKSHKLLRHVDRQLFPLLPKQKKEAGWRCLTLVTMIFTDSQTPDPTLAV